MKSLFLNPLVLAGLLALPTIHSSPAAESGARLSLRVHQGKEDLVEGPSKSRSYLELGATKIAMREPTKSRIESSTDAMTIDLRSRGLKGYISISRSSCDAQVGFAPSNVNAYAEIAAGMLPQAEKLEVGKIKVNPYVGNGWSGLAFQYSYESRHLALRREVAFVNFDESNQLVVSVEGAEDNFDQILALAQEFMASWYPMTDHAVVSYN